MSTRGKGPGAGVRSDEPNDPGGAVAGANRTLDDLERAGRTLIARPALEIARVLGEVGLRFLDPADPLSRAAVDRIPGETGLSSAMAALVVRGMATDWTPERLERLVREDFPAPAVLDRFTQVPSGRRLRATGGRLAFHLSAGNVPGVGTTTLIRSLLVKTPVLLKPGRGDRVLPTLFAEGLAERDPELARAMRVAYWPRGEGGALERACLQRSERIVVYGGMDAVARIRSMAPTATPIVAYHHRVSLAAISRETLRSPDCARRAARDLALAISTFDQAGCVSPHIAWIEEEDALPPAEWAELVAGELERLAASLPPAPVAPETAADLQQRRGLFLFRAGQPSPTGDERAWEGANLAWTLFLERADRPMLTGGARTLSLRPIASLDELPAHLEPWTGHLQSVALEAPEERRLALAEALHRKGVSRITTLARLPWPEAWWMHDGAPPLRALVRWSELDPSWELPDPRGEPGGKG